MNRSTTILALTLTLTLAGACRQETASEGSIAPETGLAPAAMTPEQLGALGAQIRKEPDRADELLSEHGMTRDSFEQAIRDVTENPDAARRYTAAYRQASA